MNIYSKYNILRSNLHASEDSELIQEISGEEYVNVKLSSNYFIPFQIGDYVTVYGSTYRLKKIPSPIDKNGSNRFEYTLKFESNRADLADVNLQLFDNTTIEVVPAYNPSTTYSSGNVVSYHTLHWQYINATPSSGNTPAENDYWALKSTVTNYVPDYSAATNYTYGNIVSYNNNYYMHIGSTDTAGVAPVEGEHWTVVKTAPMWDFSTILTPTRYAQLIVDNMNRARPNQTWTVGYCIPAEPKETTFSNVKCLEACSSIAELFETEFWIDGYSINFGKRSNATAITMAYGKGNGFKKVTRNEVTESRKVTRLIALGAEKNLLGTYRNGSNRLMLPNKYYLDAVDIDLSSPMEDTQTWDEIYPTMQHATENYNNTTTYYVGNQVLYSGYSWDCIEQCTGVNPEEGSYWKYSEGTVTTSLGQYKLIDKNLSFDPLSLDVRMKDGTIPKIKFFTGNLAGYEFPITGYIADTKQITIQQISDSTDSLLPTASYGFKVGDRFGFVDLYMPSTYVQKAEARLLAKAQDFLDKYSVDQVSYAGEVDEIWATTNSIELKIGDLIHFNDPDFLISLDYRIVKLTRNLTRSYKYTIELSTLPYIPSKITSITNKITQNETYIEYNGLNKKMSKSKTFLGAHEAIDMAFDPAGDYFTDKIKPLIVETSALLVGTEQQQYKVTGLTFKSYASTPNIISWSAGSISDSSVEDIERAWNIVAGSFTATDVNAAYYCYARCVRASGSTSAELKFDTAQHKTEEGTDYYYFLLGSLSSVINGMRQLYTSKGFTFINGDTIITGRIQSENGEVDIDLANETMHFGNDEKYIDYNNGTFKVKGNLVVSPSGIEFPTPCFRGTYDNIYTYYKGDTVTSDGYSWMYINSNSSSGITPSEGAYWTIYASKGTDGISAKSVTVTGEQIFKYPKGSAIPTNTSIVLTSVLQNLSSLYQWKYYNGASWVNFTGETASVFTLAYNNPAFTGDLLRVRCFSSDNYDEITITKIYEGSDALNVVLTNESHTIACDKDGAPKTGEIAKANTTIQVYRGSVLLTWNTDWVIDELAPSGGSFSQSNGSVLFGSFDTGNISSECEIGIMIGSVFIYKTFKVTKSIDGQTGATGSPGAKGNYFEHRYAVNGSPTSAPPINVSSSDPSIVVGEITYTWSLTLPTQGLMEYTWMTTAEKTSAGVLVANWSTPQRITGIQGETGSSGAAISYKGVWSSLIQYVGNSLVVNVVKDGSTYYIARVDAGIIPKGTSTSNTTYWNSIGTSFESIATGLLLAQSAYIENLIVSQLATSANPNSTRLSNIDSGIGIFKNKYESNYIDNAIIKIGKDLSENQGSGERKPSIVVSDLQWRGLYNSNVVYYKDDRVYYSDSGTIKTYIFIYEWDETQDPENNSYGKGHLPTNTDYWSFIGTGRLDGGGLSEIGSEGVYCDGSNTTGFSSAVTPTGNASGVFLLNKNVESKSMISSAIVGVDTIYINPTIWASGTSYTVKNKVYYNSKFYNCILATNSELPTNTTYWEEYISSKTYGGWFNTLYAGSLRRSCRRVSTSQTLSKLDSIIHCYNTSNITITLPIPDDSMIGMELRIRNMGTNAVLTVSTPSQFPIFNNAVHTSLSIGGYDLVSICWDGNYWVWNYMSD